MSAAADDLALAVHAAREAGGVVMKAFRTEQKVTFKSPDQPLTQADLASDAILKQNLLAPRPGYGWLSEETADTPTRLACELVWIVDPIDGTNSFVAGRPEFAISIALAQRGEALLGVVYNPASDELFTAVRGQGAHKVRRGGGASGRRGVESLEERLRVALPPGRAIIAASRSDLQRGEFAAFVSDHDILPTGSTAYKLARVAEGVAHIYLSRGPKSEWDVCAGDLLVTEAGGKVTDLAGATLQYNRRNPHITGVVAAHAALHAGIRRHIHEMHS
jgi:myo-inositol-1(or 4)-monophosphatase